jgi:hypothetical protein
MNAIDGQFTGFLGHMIWLTLQLVSVLSAAVYSIGLWALIPGVIIFVVGLVVGLIYLRCQISIRREMK